MTQSRRLADSFVRLGTRHTADIPGRASAVLIAAGEGMRSRPR